MFALLHLVSSSFDHIRTFVLFVLPHPPLNHFLADLPSQPVSPSLNHMLRVPVLVSCLFLRQSLSLSTCPSFTHLRMLLVSGLFSAYRVLNVSLRLSLITLTQSPLTLPHPSCMWPFLSLSRTQCVSSSLTYSHLLTLTQSP